MKNLKFTESYFYNGQHFSQRKDFFDLQDKTCHFPHFASHTKFDYGRFVPMYDAIKNYISSVQADSKTVYLLNSGGIDSELIFFVALQMGVKVIPVMVDLFGINSYEMTFAKKFIQQNNITDYVLVEVSEREFNQRWLPELIYDTESLSILLAGAYIAARSCPAGAPILYSGENPDQIYVKEGRVYFKRHEYSFWPQKVAQTYDLQLHELYSHHEVIQSLLAYPAISERLFSAVPHQEWFADHEYLGKEYYYTDPSFKQLRRRYAQHGWESRKGGEGYQKGMRAINPTSKSLVGRGSLINPESAIPFLLHCLSKKQLDYDLAHKALFEDYVIDAVGMDASIYTHTFNRQFYVYLGQLSQDGFMAPPDESCSRVLTSSEGKIISTSL